MNFKYWNIIKKYKSKDKKAKERKISKLIKTIKSKNTQIRSSRSSNNYKIKSKLVKLFKEGIPNKYIKSNNIKGMSIRKKILLLIASLIIISMVTTSIFTYIKSSDIIFNQSKAEMMSVNKRGNYSFFS